MLVALLAAAAVPVATAAVEAGFKADDAATKECNNKAMTQVEINGCAAASFQRADAALNVQWSKTFAVYKRSDAENKDDGDGEFAVGADNLLKGQRAWLIYREATCRAVASLSGRGTITPMNFSYCMADITWKRTRELADLTINPNSGEQM